MRRMIATWTTTYHSPRLPLHQSLSTCHLTTPRLPASARQGPSNTGDQTLRHEPFDGACLERVRRHEQGKKVARAGSNREVAASSDSDSVEPSRTAGWRTTRQSRTRREPAMGHEPALRPRSGAGESFASVVCFGGALQPPTQFHPECRDGCAPHTPPGPGGPSARPHRRAAYP